MPQHPGRPHIFNKVSNQKNKPQAGCEQSILVVGPGIPSQAWNIAGMQRSSYMRRLLEEMVRWCIRENIIDQYATITNFRKLFSSEESLAYVVYKLEEYLVDKSQQQQCLKEILPFRTPLSDIYLYLVQMPFRGYITTTYDTFIETAYLQVKQAKLAKFYRSSLPEAIKAGQSSLPFILKLYGDIDDAYSFNLRGYLLKDLSLIDQQDQVRALLSLAPVHFIGFEQTDPDLVLLKNLIAGKNVVDEKHTAEMTVLQEKQLPIETTYPIHTSSATAIPSQTVKTTSKRGTFVNKPATADTTDPLQGDSVADVAPQSQTSSTTEEDGGRTITIFIAYAPVDEELKNLVEQQLEILNEYKWQQEGLDVKWDAYNVIKHPSWTTDVHDPLTSYSLVLLLISSDFLVSNYCKSPQMRNAVELSAAEQVKRILPILLRPCPWKLTPFYQYRLPVLPTDGDPVTEWERKGKGQDRAFVDISEGIATRVDALRKRLP